IPPSSSSLHPLSPPPPPPPPSPYTTLFRSRSGRRLVTLAGSGGGAPSRSSTSSTQRSPAEENARKTPALGPSSAGAALITYRFRSEEHTSELQSRENLVCRLLLEKKKKHTL